MLIHYNPACYVLFEGGKIAGKYGIQIVLLAHEPTCHFLFQVVDGEVEIVKKSFESYSKI